MEFLLNVKGKLSAGSSVAFGLASESNAVIRSVTAAVKTLLPMGKGISSSRKTRL